MSNLNVYTIYDCSVENYNVPFFAKTDAEAQRIVASSCQSGSLLLNYPEDFVLYRIGDFDTETGIIVHDAPLKLCDVRSLIPRRPENGDLFDQEVSDNE